MQISGKLAILKTKQIDMVRRYNLYSVKTKRKKKKKLN